MVDYAAVPASVPDGEGLPFVLQREPDRSACIEVDGYRVRRGSAGLWAETDRAGLVLAVVLRAGEDGCSVLASLGDVVDDLWTLTGVSDADVAAYPVLGAALTGQPVVRHLAGRPVPSRFLRPSAATGVPGTVVATSLPGDLERDWRTGLEVALPVVAVALEALVEYDRLWRTDLAELAQAHDRGDRAAHRLEATGTAAALARQVLAELGTPGTGQ